MIVPVILSGGSGTRLWPLSTAERPKQFISLVGEESLFRQTLARVADRQVFAAPVVVANNEHLDLLRAEIAGYDDVKLILEPCARNTAAAIVMAAALVKETYGDGAMMLVMPSDHLIANPANFHRAIQLGAQAASTGRLVTFGITPTGPEIGYGYLKAGDPLAECNLAFDVAKFTEKPDLPTAQSMIATGHYYWNGGIFLFRANDIIDEAGKLAAEVRECASTAIAEAEHAGECVWPAFSALADCPNISIDYAIMERSDRVAMIPMDADWSDVGSWDALADLRAIDADQSFVTGLDFENCYVRSDGLKVGLLGVRDLVIVASGNQLLVMRKGSSQQIRELAAQVAAMG